MGEWELMDNIQYPTMQRLTRKIIGFPMPFIPYGAYFLPIPRRPKSGLTVIVGQAIDFECAASESAPSVSSTESAVQHPPPPLCAPTEEEVDRVHAAYFEALATMFERHKAACGYPDHTLVMLDNPRHMSGGHKGGKRD